jgi:rhodanese-related sulfurtransferase
MLFFISRFLPRPAFCHSAAMKKLRRTVRELVDEANAEIESVSAKDAIELAKRPDVLIVDLRDPREREREGFIPGAFHAPRGMLEFWVDPESPYFKDVFGSGKRFVFHCASGWRSALATKAVQDMGLPGVSHIATGFKGWVEAGGPVEREAPRKG